jgi:TRAP-type uncharacterized transport system substrate-binding protein
MKIEFLRAHWHVVTIAVTVAAIACGAIALLATMPPRTIVMATGPEEGAYHQIGKKYQAALAREGVRVRLIATAGALENLALLRDPRSEVTVALIQSGTTSGDEAPNLESLGTLFYEPLWVFYRRGMPALTFEGMRGRTVSIGTEGSGGRALSLELLKRNRADQFPAELLALAPQEAGEKLISGEIDVAFILMSWDGRVVQQLIAHELVELATFPRADAYVASFPFLSKLLVPAGVGDLGKRRPPSDVTLLAPKASLVVRSDLHSAIQYLLLNSAVHIHSNAGIFQCAGQFPAAEGIDLPLSNVALQFHKSGRPFLQDHLPFWLASLVARLLVLLIPILAVMYPMVRLLPAFYGWLMRSRVARLYGELRFLENEIETGADAKSLIARLDELERQAGKLRMPTRYASMMYLLRDHIALVRERLKGT